MLALLRYVLLVVAAALACPSMTGVAQSTFSSRVIASGLGSPWEVTWGPDAHLWVTERTARRVVRVDPATGAVTPALTIEESYDLGRAWHEGVMGLALHPDLLKAGGRDYLRLFLQTKAVSEKF